MRAHTCYAIFSDFIVTNCKDTTTLISTLGVFCFLKRGRWGGGGVRERVTVEK